MKKFILIFYLIVNFCGCQNTTTKQIDFNKISQEMSKKTKIKKIIKTEAEWKVLLNEDEYRILREKGTEAPHTGIYNLHFENGTYNCAGCNSALFESSAKFDSNCGWPSFDKSIDGKISYSIDKSFGMLRTEIICSSCDGHLGHIFNDGPTQTGMRYCVNSLSLDFKKEKN